MIYRICGLFGLSTLSTPRMDELGSRFGPTPGSGPFTRPAYKYFFNPASWTWGVGLRAYFLNPISCPPALGYVEYGQGLYHFLNRVRLPLGRSGLVWLRLCHRQTSCDNDDFSTFVLISCSSFGFF